MWQLMCRWYSEMYGITCTTRSYVKGPCWTPVEFEVVWVVRSSERSLCPVSVVTVCIYGQSWKKRKFKIQFEVKFRIEAGWNLTSKCCVESSSSLVTHGKVSYAAHLVGRQKSQRRCGTTAMQQGDSCLSIFWILQSLSPVQSFIIACALVLCMFL